MLVETRAAPGGQHLRQDLQRVVVRRVAFGHVVSGNDLWQTRKWILHGLYTLFVVVRLSEVDFRRRRLVRNVAEVFLHLLHRYLGIKIAHQSKDGVVGGIVDTEEIFYVFYA